MATNVNGRFFISYRRGQQREAEVDRLSLAMAIRGIPSWVDRRDLAMRPTIEELEKILASSETAGAVLYMTSDILADSEGEASSIIRKIEAPRIVERARRDDRFVAIVLIAPDLTYEDGPRIYGTGVDLAFLPGRNSIRVPAEGLSGAQASTVSAKILRERLNAVKGALEPNDPLRISLYTRVAAPIDGTISLPLDWSSQFNGRHCDQARWDNLLLPALKDVMSEVRREVSGREIVGSGQLGIPAAIALGETFSSTSGLNLIWMQTYLGKTEPWRLGPKLADSGIRVTTSPRNLKGTDIALLISVTQDVAPEVNEFLSSLPGLAAIVRVETERTELSAEAASTLAQEARAALIKARAEYRASGVIHVFLAGPVGLAVLVGQQLNTFAAIQTYERDPNLTPTYVASCMVKPV